MEWRPAALSECLPLLIFPCTIKSRSSLLAPAHLGGPGKRAVKWLCGGGFYVTVYLMLKIHALMSCSPPVKGWYMRIYKVRLFLECVLATDVFC